LKIRSSRFITGDSQTLINYPPLDNDFGVERRWLDTHPTAEDVGDSKPNGPSLSEDEVLELAQSTMRRIEMARTEFAHATLDLDRP